MLPPPLADFGAVLLALDRDGVGEPVLLIEHRYVA